MGRKGLCKKKEGACFNKPLKMEKGKEFSSSICIGISPLYIR